MKKKIILAALVVLALAGIWWNKNRDEALPVKVVKVDRGLVEATVSNTKAGTIKACRRSKLSMRSGGVVDKLFVKEGDQVRQGQLLLELWNRERRTNLAQANATLKASIEKVRLVCGENPASTECEMARAHQQVAEDVKRDVENVIDRNQLRAPFDGVVAEINGEVGEYVTPSPPGVLTPPAIDLIDYSCLYVTAPIDEVDAGQLRIGMNVQVTLDAFRDRHFTGKITRIAPYVVDLEKQARTVDIDVRLNEVPEDVRLLIGYSADTTVILDQRDNVLRVPTETLLTGGFVWKVKADQTLEKRQVKTGIGNWTNTEILEGLAEGDAIVRTPDQIGLAENKAVEILPDKAE